MEVKELRIGNILYFPFISKNVEVIGINSYESNSGQLQYKLSLIDPEGNLYCEPISVLQPIPLTEEWLLKFRFEKPHTDFFDKGRFSIWRDPKTFKGFIADWADKTIGEVKYVHQVQNLFFCLCGEDL